MTTYSHLRCVSLCKARVYRVSAGGHDMEYCEDVFRILAYTTIYLMKLEFYGRRIFTIVEVSSVIRRPSV